MFQRFCQLYRKQSCFEYVLDFISFLCYALYMKNFIVNVNKNKKWITLGLSILNLILFCFPILTVTHMSNDKVISSVKLPFFLHVARYWANLWPNLKHVIHMHTMEDSIYKAITMREFGVYISCGIFMVACLVFAIFYLVCVFKNQKSYYTPSIVFALLTMLAAGIYLRPGRGLKYTFRPYPTFYVFLIFLLLDVAYLFLEWYYLRGGKEKLSERKIQKTETANKANL